MSRRILASLAALALLGSGASLMAEDGVASSWRELTLRRDQERLDNWRSVFEQARADAINNDYAVEVDNGGVLYRVDAAYRHAPIPDGRYRCNVTKMGGDLLQFIAYDYFRCDVKTTKGRKAFTKRTGSQRVIGHIYPGDKSHDVLLGTMQLADETAVIPYGSDADRDEAGRVERIGAKRWRILFPAPTVEGDIVIMDLQPVR